MGIFARGFYDGGVTAELSYRTATPWPLRRPSCDAHYLLYARAFAAASALRLTLPDAMQGSWFAPALLNWLGVLLLAFNGCIAGWTACAIGSALPILLLGDQLTQSAYLTFCAAAAVACLLGPGTRHVTGGLQASVRCLTVSVYALAALHKLNSDYFDPMVSCANEGLRVLTERSPGVFSSGIIESFESAAWPIVHLTVELTIALCLWLRPRQGVALAALMHLPLTIIYAPGFAFTLMSGWVCFFERRELDELWQFCRRHWRAILVTGGIPATMSRAFLFPGRWSTDPDWCIKEAILWMVAAALLLAALPRHHAPRVGAKRQWPPWLGGVVVGTFIANGLTPYFGAQFHHTAAMLSNLRIDASCYNSLVIPEALRGPHDPYVRIDDIQFAPHRAPPEKRHAVTERLWSLSALHRARSIWCHIHIEPLPLRGTFRGIEFSTDDFCTDWPLPQPTLKTMRRFQVNLNRTCPQRCLH